MFSDRSTAFALGLVTFLAMFIFLKGLIRVAAEGHPDSKALTALDTLTS